MEKKNLLVVLILVLMLVQTASAQRASTLPGPNGKRDNGMIYHDGPVMQGTNNVYLIFYGNWPQGQDETVNLLAGFILNLGASQYFRINRTYPDSSGQAPSGVLFFGGSTFERSYSYGAELDESEIQKIVTDRMINGDLPLDAQGIYMVIATPDVSSESTGFCSPLVPPHHSTVPIGGALAKYAFIGNAARCPTVAAPQFVAPDGSFLPTPNGNLAADAMFSTIAHALNAIVTNPLGTAWYDRYGFENADKCVGKFGSTYLTANGARANMSMGGRHYLIQQNWVNTPIGYCAPSEEGLGSGGARGAR